MRRTSPLALLLACGGTSAGTSTAVTSDSTSAATSNSPTGTTAADTSASTGLDVPCDSSPDAVADCVEAERYATDLEFIAAVRDPGSPHWQAVQDLCFNRLTDLGYQVELHEYGTGINVIGRRLGTTTPEEIVLVGAHYDHIPDCSGADDNGTGLAATLEIARVLADVSVARTIMIACWDEEELGLIGSRAFASQSAQDGTQVVANFTLETMGFTSNAPNSQQIPPGLDLAFPDTYSEIEANEFRGDSIILMANAAAETAATDFIAQADRIGLKTALLALPSGTETSPLFSELRRSDHAPFWDEGYPAMMLTDSANFRNPNYHCIGGPDEIVDLDEAFAVLVTRATAGAAASAAGL